MTGQNDTYDLLDSLLTVAPKTCLAPALTQQMTEAGIGRSSPRTMPPDAIDFPDPNDLLRSLLDVPPSGRERRAPVALRSVAAHRAYALRGFCLRTWFDRALLYGERILAVAALAFFAFWFADGSVRDWLHERSPATSRVAAASSATPPPAALSASPLKPASPRAAALPFTTEDMERAEPRESGLPAEPSFEPLVDDFIAPRQGVPARPTAVDPRPARLAIPAIALDTPIKETFIVDGAWEVAEYAAGYMNGTALPGDGNTALAGHAGLRGAVFRDLGRLAPGDDVYLDAGGWRYHYRVRETKAVWPEQVEVLDPTPTPVLTMLTCVNWDTQRLVVVADLVGSRPLPRNS